MSAPTIVVRPNASLSTRQARALLIGMCAISFSIAGILAAMGYWMILPFAGLEMACLAAGLYIAMRDNAYREVLRVSGDQLCIEHGRGKPERRQCIPLHWATVCLQPAKGPTQHLRVEVRYAGRGIEVGSVLAEDEREAFAKHLQQWLSQARATPLKH